eukprot:Gb_39031 [translate_table: standard]
MDRSRHSVPGGAMEGEKSLGLFGHAMKRKDSFIHLMLMGGVLLLSMRCVGQKYRIQDLQDERASLRDENESLKNKFSDLKQGLLEEAAKENDNRFMSKLQALFADPVSEPGIVGESKGGPSELRVRQTNCVSNQPGWVYLTLQRIPWVTETESESFWLVRILQAMLEHGSLISSGRAFEP